MHFNVFEKLLLTGLIKNIIMDYVKTDAAV